MLKFLGKKSIFLAAIAAIVGVVLGALEVIFSGVLVYMLGLIGLSDDKGFLSQVQFFDGLSSSAVLSCFVAVAALKALFQITKGYFAVYANEHFVSRLRFVCIDSVLQVSSTSVDTSRLYSLISDVFSRSALVFYSFVHSIPLILQAGVIFFFLTSLSYQLSIYGTTYLVFIAIIIIFVQRYIARVVSPLAVLNDKLHHSIKKIFDNLLMIRIYRLESREKGNVLTILDEYLLRTRRSNFLSLLSENIPSALGAVVIVGLIIVQLENNYLEQLNFISFLYLFLRFVQVLGQLAGFVGIGVSNAPYFRKAYHFFRSLDDKVSSQSGLLFVDVGTKRAVVTLNEPTTANDLYPNFDVAAPVIQINNIDFGFSDDLIIKNLSVSVQSGEQLVITGPSGSGKSTLLSLMMGLEQPVAGSITIGNKTPDQFVDQHGGSIGFAGPDPFIIEGSIRENLLFGNHFAVEEEDLLAMLRRLKMDEWLERIDCNLDLRFGHGKAAASTGQRQRISIARALLRRPKLLVLDEVTANLDSVTELELLSVVSKLKGFTTTVIVTHRPAMAQYADHKIEMGS
jgi:ABC-type multidrug transport system fused ATPase/permease subunit